MIHPTAIIYPNVKIGRDVYIGAFSVIGSPPEHRDHYGKDGTGVVIGDGVKIFEYVTIHAGTTGRPTLVDASAAIFNHAHVGHDCIVGTGAIIGGGVRLAGHTMVDPYATVSGNTCTHQHVIIGAFAFIGGMSFVTSHVPPGEKWVGVPARPCGVNEVGLLRYGLTIDDLHNTHREVFEKKVKESKL